MHEKDLDLKEYVKMGDKWFCVSTVDLLGIEHHGGTYFETMIFGSDGEKITDYSDRFCERYKTKQEAKEGHKMIVKKFKGGELTLSEPYEAFKGKEGSAEDLTNFFLKGISRLK